LRMGASTEGELRSRDPARDGRVWVESKQHRQATRRQLTHPGRRSHAAVMVSLCSELDPTPPRAQPRGRAPCGVCDALRAALTRPIPEPGRILRVRTSAAARSPRPIALAGPARGAAGAPVLSRPGATSGQCRVAWRPGASGRGGRALQGPRAGPLTPPMAPNPSFRWQRVSSFRRPSFRQIFPRFCGILPRASAPRTLLGAATR
jgi:hypothetical protein